MADTRAPDRPDVSATAPSKLPSEARQAPLARSATDADVADFVRRMKELGPQAAVGRGRLVFAMDATMSRQPTWDMALALQADMFTRGEGGGRARRAARLFPRHRRVPRLEVGVGPRRAGGADDAGALRRRLHADRQGAEPRAHGRRPSAGQRARLRRRLHGGGDRRPVRARRRAGAAGRAGVPVPGGSRRTRRARLPRDRPADQGCLLPLRCGLGAPAARPACGRRRLCRGRAQGAAGAERARRARRLLQQLK